MTKQRVQLWGKPQGYAVVDTEATNGAVLGVNIRLPDGTLATKEDFATPVPDVERLQQTVLVNIKEQTRLLVEEQQARDQAVADALLQAAADAQDKVDAAKALIDAEVDGLQAQLNDFAGQADDWSDLLDYPEGDYVKSGGKLYRALQDVPAGTPLTDTAYWQQLGNYSSAGEAISAALVMSTQNASDISAESQRVDTLFTGLGDANAEINTLQQAQSDTDQSLANFVTQTQASFGDVDAQIIAANQARVDGDAANALAIQGVQAGLDGKADVSVTQALEVRANRIEGLGVGENLLQNSALSADATGWVVTGNTSAFPLELRHGDGTGWDGDTNRYTPNGVKSIAVRQIGTPTTSDYAQFGSSKPVRLDGITRVAASVRYNTFRCRTSITIAFLNEAGGVVSYAQSVVYPQSYAFPVPSADSMPRMVMFADKPAGAVACKFSINVLGNGEANPAGYFYQPMLSAVPAGSSIAPVYSVGGAEMFARHSVILDVGGNISGTVSENDGKRSVFSVLADVFRVIASGSVGMEIMSRAGGYFMRFYAGAAQIIIGVNFGQANNLFFWYGPNVGEASATKANGTVSFDSSGSAYFGGELHIGVLKNAAKSTQVSTTASVETGSFATNGTQKIVTSSLSYNVSGILSTNKNGHTASATIVVERSINGGAWTQVATYGASGTYVAEYDPGAGYITELSLGGSVTHTDNNTSTSNHNYRARITSASGWPVTMQNGSNGTQTLSIMSVEDP